MFSIEFYEKENGVIPFVEFYNSQNSVMKARILHHIELLESKGNLLFEPYSKHLGNGIFELRIRSSNRYGRVLYFFYINKRIIITHGFIKKTNKTPINEIEKAERYRTKWLEGERNEI